MTQQKSTRFSAAKVANFGVVMVEMMGKMDEMEKEIKRLRHHVSVLSKRNHQLVKDGKSRAASPIASNVSLSEEEDEGVASESPVVAEGMGDGAVAEVVAEDVAEATLEAGAVAIEFRGKRRRLEIEMGLEDEDVVVGGKIVPLGALELRRVEVVEVGSSMVVPKAPRAIQEMKEREVVHGAPAGPRGSGGTGVGMEPSGRRGLHRYGTRSGIGGGSGGVPYPFGYGDVGRGRGYRGRGRGGGYGRWG